MSSGKKFKIQSLYHRLRLVKVPYLIAILTSACLIRETNISNNFEDQKNAPSLPLDNPLAFDVIVEADKRTPLATFKAHSCEPLASFHEWQIKVSTPTGPQELPIFIPLTTHEPYISIRADKTLIHTDLTKEYPFEEASALCRNVNSERPISISNRSKLFSHFQKLLFSVAPDCRWTVVSKQGWTCQLDHLEPQVALERINNINRDLIKRWKRVPYLLSRRLAITAQLASSIKKSSESGLGPVHDFCLVAKNSFSEEQPLSITSKNWRDKFCTSSSIQEVTLLGQIALAKALQEIDTLVVIADKTNHTGLLRIEIPKGTFGNQNIRVKLKPMEDVKKFIKEVQSQIWLDWQQSGGYEHVTDAVTSTWKSCWHPLFETKSLLIARDLGLAGHGDTIICPDEDSSLTVDKREANESLNYIINSVLGETSFLATSGDSKILRLPQGQYEYTLYEESEDFRHVEDPTDQEVKGSITWLKESHPTIRALQQLTN